MQSATDAAAEEVSANVSTALDTVNDMVNGFIELLPKLAVALVVFFLFYLLARGARAAVQRTSTRERGVTNVGRVLGRLARAGVIAVGFLVALSIVAPGVGVTELMGLLGAGGVAFAFALQDIFQNFVAGLLILLRKPFKVGDQIRSNDYEGTVESIETRSTIIKTYDGRRVVIPNGEIYTTPTEVNTAYGRRRSQYDVGIGYGDDARQASRVMLEAMQGVEGVLEDPAPDVVAMELAGSSVNLRARWWTKAQQADVMRLGHEVILTIKEALDEAQIDMPYPTNVTLFHDQTEATDGDRTQQREGWPAGEAPPEPRTISHTLHEIAEKTGAGGDGRGGPSDGGARPQQAES